MCALNIYVLKNPSMRQVPKAPRDKPVPDEMTVLAELVGGTIMTNTWSGEWCIDIGDDLRALPGDWIVREGLR